MTKKSENTAKKIVVNEIGKEPLTESEVKDFWQNHQVGDKLLALPLELELQTKLQQARSQRKSRSITLNLSEGLKQRLHQIAELEGVGDHTLIKQFLLERTYQEEVRRGIIK